MGLGFAPESRLNQRFDPFAAPGKLRLDGIAIDNIGAGHGQGFETKNPAPMVWPLALRMRRVEGSSSVMVAALFAGRLRFPGAGSCPRRGSSYY